MIRAAISPRFAIRHAADGQMASLTCARARVACAVFGERSVGDQDFGHRAAHAGAHRVHQLHHFDDGDDRFLFDLSPDLHERRRAGLWGAIERAQQRRGNLVHVGIDSRRQPRCSDVEAHCSGAIDAGAMALAMTGLMAPTCRPAAAPRLRLIFMPSISSLSSSKPDCSTQAHDFRDFGGRQTHRLPPKIDMTCNSGSSRGACNRRRFLRRPHRLRATLQQQDIAASRAPPPTRCPAGDRSGVRPCARSSSAPAAPRRSCTAVRRRSSGTETLCVPPIATGTCWMSFSEISRTEISPVILPSTQRSGVTSPPTTAEPRPQEPSMVITERSPVSGLRVNITPAVRASTIFCTTTAMATPCFGQCPACAGRLPTPPSTGSPSSCAPVAGFAPGPSPTDTCPAGPRSWHRPRLRSLPRSARRPVSDRRRRRARVSRRNLLEHIGWQRFCFNSARSSAQQAVTAARSSASSDSTRDAHRRFALQRPDESLERTCLDDESRRHRDAGALQLAQAAALTADLRPVVQSDIGKPTDDFRR